jgi:hypothetical protein
MTDNIFNGPWGDLVAENLELRTEQVISKLSNPLEGKMVKELVKKVAETIWKCSEDNELNTLMKTMRSNSPTGFFTSIIKRGPLSSEDLDSVSSFGFS